MLTAFWTSVWQDQYRWQGCIYGAASGCLCNVRLELSVCAQHFEEHLVDSMKGSDVPTKTTITVIKSLMVAPLFMQF